jgi:hypothetical protein
LSCDVQMNLAIDPPDLITCRTFLLATDFRGLTITARIVLVNSGRIKAGLPTC